MEITEITVGKNTFKITDSILEARGVIYSRNFKIGGKHPDCVNISITYQNNEPISASMPFLMYDPECSNEGVLERGQGSVIMIKTLLMHVHKKMPSITEVNFEDKSNIECATIEEIEKKGSRFRKKGTNVFPIPLYYFSIAFNGETWYEKNFQARQKNLAKHNAYREKVSYILHSSLKSETPFIRFLEIAKPQPDVLSELEEIYGRTETFNDFFQSIEKKDRCRILRTWIYAFMEHFLKDVFQNTDWIIELSSIVAGGAHSLSKTRQTRRKYYCPKGTIRRNSVCKDIGVRYDDV